MGFCNDLMNSVSEIVVPTLIVDQVCNHKFENFYLPSQIG